MSNVQSKKQEALAKLQAARALLDQVDALMAQAEEVLEVEGGYTEHGVGDVTGVVRDSIGELEELVRDYVN